MNQTAQWLQRAASVGLLALLPGAVAGMAAAAEPALVEDFSARPEMKAFMPEQRGGEFSVVDAPGKAEEVAGRLGWREQHEGFLEFYYVRDVAIRPSGEPKGVLTATLRSDQPQAVWSVALRVKDSSGEIFHFDSKIKLEADTWAEVPITIADGGHQSHWGGNNDGKLDGPLLLTGYAVLINESAPAGGVLIEHLTWEPSQTEAARATTLPGSAAADQYPLAQAHLFEPFWKSPTVYGESVALIKEDDASPANGTLLFEPARVLQVRGSDGATVYEEGRDYRVDAANRRLVLTPGSRIASIGQAELYKKPGDPRSIKHKAGDPDTYLLYAEQWFRTVQVEVDYEHRGEWDGFTPAFAGDQLRRTLTKLERKEPIQLLVLGDSIASGANATSSKVPPHMPPFAKLLAGGLTQAYASPVTLTNLAVGGATADGWAGAVDRLGELKPDLVLIAYGMNDVAGRKPSNYATRIQELIGALRVVSPPTEFILIASSVANPEWNWSPAEEFPRYRDALASLALSASPGVALADATTLWTDILRHKRYIDLTGNGVNHPNDYGHRLYAQLLLSMFTR